MVLLLLTLDVISKMDVTLELASFFKSVFDDLSEAKSCCSCLCFIASGAESGTLPLHDELQVLEHC